MVNASKVVREVEAGGDCVGEKVAGVARGSETETNAPNSSLDGDATAGRGPIGRRWADGSNGAGTGRAVRPDVDCANRGDEEVAEDKDASVDDAGKDLFVWED